MQFTRAAHIDEVVAATAWNNLSASFSAEVHRRAFPEKMSRVVVCRCKHAALHCVTTMRCLVAVERWFSSGNIQSNRRHSHFTLSREERPLLANLLGRLDTFSGQCLLEMTEECNARIIVMFYLARVDQTSERILRRLDCTAGFSSTEWSQRSRLIAFRDEFPDELSDGTTAAFVQNCFFC